MSNLITTGQLAARLGLKRQTLEKWRITGAGPRFTRLGSRAVRYREDDVERWLDEQATTSTSGHAQ